MVNGPPAPPCSICNYPLRWLAPQNAWGCDRCQRMFPPQMPAPQMQPAQMHASAPVHPPPMQAPQPHYGYGAQHPPLRAVPPAHVQAAPRKSKAGLVVGLTVGALAIAGGIVAVVMLTGKKDSSAAGGSREDVVKATLAALAAGDADQLVRLAAPLELHGKLFDCAAGAPPGTSAEEAEMRDPQKQLAKVKESAASPAARAKGAKLELVEVVTKPDEAGTKFAKGDALAAGCVTKEPWRMQEATVKLKIQEGSGVPVEQTVQFSLVEVGGGWYLGSPPALPVGYGTLLTQLEAWKTKACQCADAACFEQVGKSMTREVGTPSALLGEGDGPKPPPEMATKLASVLDDMTACQAKVGGAGAMLAKMRDFKDRTCACTTKACGDAVVAEATAWGKSIPEADRTSPAARPLGEEMAACLAKLASAPDAAAGPTFDTIEPAGGDPAGGTFVTIKGRGFSKPVITSILFGDERGTIVRVVSDTEIQAMAPPGVAGTNAEVVVTFEPGGAIMAGRFLYGGAAAGGDPMPAEDPAPTAGRFKPAKNLPSECEDFRRALVQADTCPKYPDGSRDELVKSWEMMLQGDAAYPSFNATTRKSTADSCRIGAKAIVDALKQLGC